MKCVFPPVLVILLISFFDSSAQLNRSTAEIAFTITRMAEIYHVQPRPVDKVFSNDLFNLLIRALDADKIYFSAEDIRKLGMYRNELDNEILDKKEDFLNQLILVYSKKINQTDSILDK